MHEWIFQGGGLCVLSLRLKYAVQWPVPHSVLHHWNNTAHQSKSNVQPRTGHEGPEVENMYSCTLSLTSEVDGGGRSTPRPATLLPGRTMFALCRSLGGTQGRSVCRCLVGGGVINFLEQLKGKGLNFVNLWLRISEGATSICLIVKSEERGYDLPDCGILI
jgi:hypothetical protein